MKLSWGYRIALLYGGFLLLIALLVGGSMMQRFDLVADNYYERELAYQDVIDADRNQQSLSAPVVMNLKNSKLEFVFPDDFANTNIAGEIWFYSPVQESWDKKVPLNITEQQFFVDAGDLQPTRYMVKLSWEANGKKYYQEMPLNLYQP